MGGNDQRENVALGICLAICVVLTGVALSGIQGSASIGPDLHRFVLEFPDLPLLPGAYVAKSHALDETGTRLYDTVEIAFRVRGESTSSGLIDIQPFLSTGEGGGITGIPR